MPQLPRPRRGRLRLLGLTARLLIPLVIVWFAWGELQALDWPQIRAEVSRSRVRVLLLAAAVMAANVLVMGLYDAVSFPGRAGLGFMRRWGIGSLCFAWSNFLTIGPIGGPAIRFVVYRRWAVPPADVARGLAVQYVGFAGGLLAWFGAAALPIAAGPAATIVRIAAAGGLAIGISLLIMWSWRWLLTRRDPASPLLGFLRGPRCLALAVIGFLDWGCSITVFSLVATSIGFDLEPAFAAATFLGGHVIGMLSMLPGGMGSADAAWLLSLTESGLEPDVAAALILLFRGVFYVLPWAVAATITLAAFGATIEDTRRWRRRALAATLSVFASFGLVAAGLPETARVIQELRAERSVVVVELSHLLVVAAWAGVLMACPAIANGSRRALQMAAALLVIGGIAQATTREDVLELVLTASVLGLLGIAWLRSRPWTTPEPERWTTPLAAAAAVVAAAIHFAGALLGLPAERWARATLTLFRHEAEGSRILRSVCMLGLMAAIAAGVAIRSELRRTRGGVAGGWPGG